MERTKTGIDEDILLELYSSQGSFLMLNSKLLKHYGPEKAVFISNLINKLRYFKTKKMIKDGWFFQSHKQQMEETGLTEYAIKKCKAKFKEDKILLIQKKGVPAIEWYKIDIRRLYEVLKLNIGQEPMNSISQEPMNSIGQEPVNSIGHIYNNNKYNNNKYNNNNNIKLHSSDLTVEENDPSINSTNLTGEDLTEEDNAPVRIKRKNLPNSETKNSKPSAKERSKKYLPLAEQLSEIIRTKKNVKTTAQQLSSWANEIRILVESNGVDYDRIQTVLDWYADHIGEEYIPVIESGNSLRHKFLRLEDAMKRENRNQKSPPGYQTSRSGVTIGSGITGTYAGIDEIALQYQREQEALEKKKRK